MNVETPPRTVTGALGFMASETSLCSELPVAAQHCALTGDTLVISSRNAHSQLNALPIPDATPVLIDTCQWSSKVATAERPSELSDGLFGMDTLPAMLPPRRNIETLSPSRFVTLHDRAARQALLAETACLARTRVITFLPTDAAVLARPHLDHLLADLAATTPRQFAFLFAAARQPLANWERLTGLRSLLAAYPGSYILGADVLAGTDALAHGAALVGVGAASSRRQPTRPKDPGGPPSVGFLPGLWLRELFDTRSPLVFADWFANEPSPYCHHCRRPLDLFDTTAGDKAAIIRHNVHAIADFVADMNRQPHHHRSAWLAQARVEAFERHLWLTAAARPIDADRALRALCEMDDPAHRSTTPAGQWT